MACPGSGAAFCLLDRESSPRDATLLPRTLARGLARVCAPSEAQEARPRDFTLGISDNLQKGKNWARTGNCTDLS